MCSRRALRIGVTTLVMLLTGCGDAGTSPERSPSSLRFVDQVDYGCVANRGGSLDCVEGATLTRIEADADTVTFWIRFEANCCPEFTEQTLYHGGVLSISVVDTVFGCRCVCPFENPFRFVRQGTGRVRVLFESRAEKNDDLCLSGLDTLVVLP